MVVVLVAAVMVVNVSLLVPSFALSPSLVRGRHDSVWVHLVLSGRYGNLDHPLLPSRHPPPGSPLPGPLKLSACLYLYPLVFSLSLARSLVLSLSLSSSFSLPSCSALFRSFELSRALFPLFPVAVSSWPTRFARFSPSLQRMAVLAARTGSLPAGCRRSDCASRLKG